MKECVKLGLNLNITIWPWYEHTPQVKEKTNQPKKNFIVLWRRYVMQLPLMTWKQLEKRPIYVQHVEGTVFTTKQIIMENEWQILHWEGIQLWREHFINIRTFTRSPGNKVPNQIGRQKTLHECLWREKYERCRNIIRSFFIKGQN